jgi:hypothetical protein
MILTSPSVFMTPSVEDVMLDSRRWWARATGNFDRRHRQF